MKSRLLFLGIFPLLILISSCGNNENVTSSVKAPQLAKDSFTVVKEKPAPQKSETNEFHDDLNPVNQFYLGVQKSALDKEFLLSASVIPQTTAATSHGLRAKVVVFKHYENKVFLLEASQGHVVTDDLPSHLILAEFPVLNETKKTLVIDFNKGMSQLFTAGAWHISDYLGKGYLGNKQFAAVPVKNSFIQNMNLKDKTLEIRQVAQIQAANVYPTYEVRYYFDPYRANKKFLAKETGKFNKVGYFEVPPQLELNTGRSVVYIGKWDHHKPIVYSVSANTPQEWVDTVKEGVLYWNKAFGKEVVQVQVAPQGVTSPNPHYNLVQWVPWGNAGFAYADMQMDPRTGENIHAQVYLTSAFAMNSKRTVRILLDRVKRMKEEKKNDHGHLLTLDFMSGSRLCEFSNLDHLENIYTEILADKNITDERILQISKDYVRTVVAHEIGHTLGLRHNFAGSLASHFSSLEKKELFLSYLKDYRVPEVEVGVFSSSVMDYLRFDDDAMTGLQVLNDEKALPYDELAVQWAYENKSLKDSDVLFCTDSHTAKYHDCKRFDSGLATLERNNTGFFERVNKVPQYFIERFIRAKNPADARDLMTVQEVPLNTANDLTILTPPATSVLQWFSKKTRSLKVERGFHSVSPIFKEDLEKDQWSWVAEQLELVGGVDALFLSVFPSEDNKNYYLTDTWKQKLLTMLETKEIKDIFSVEELNYIAYVSDRYFAILEKDLYKSLLTSLSKFKFEDPETLFAFESNLAEIAETFVFTMKEKREEGKVGIFDFYFSDKLRALAASLLSPTMGDLSDWGMDQRKVQKERFEKLIESAFGKKLGEVKLPDLPRDQRKWLMAQRKILALLSK